MSLTIGKFNNLDESLHKFLRLLVESDVFCLYRKTYLAFTVTLLKEKRMLNFNSFFIAEMFDNI